ncbi:MAG TPA: cytochrome c [Terriglobales bacterium]|jgi:mono/diheme cytochrome c family protein
MKVMSSKPLALAALVAVTAVLPVSAFAQSAQDLYKSKCSICHAADGTGNTPAGKKMEVKSFADVAKNSDATWVDITKKGKGKMPAYAGKLTDSQITDVIAYVRTLAKK